MVGNPQFIDALNSIVFDEDPDSPLQAMARFLANTGFSNYNYGVVASPLDEKSAPALRFISTMDPGWIEYYGDRRLDLVDFTAEHVKEGRLSPVFMGNGLKSYMPELSPAQQEVMDLAGEAGLSGGISMALPSVATGADLTSGICISSGLPGHEIEAQWKEHRAEILIVLNLVQQRIGGTLQRLKHDRAVLGQREMDCLSYLARGHRPQRIAQTLGLADITVHTYLRNARKKLGAKTMPHAVAIAMQRGFITL